MHNVKYCALLRTSFKRQDFMAHALNLIVAGIVIKCSIVLQIGICVRQKVSFHRSKIRNFHTSSASLFTVLIKVIAKYFEVLRTCRVSVAMDTIYVIMLDIIV